MSLLYIASHFLCSSPTKKAVVKSAAIPAHCLAFVVVITKKYSTTVQTLYKIKGFVLAHALGLKAKVICDNRLLHARIPW